VEVRQVVVVDDVLSAEALKLLRELLATHTVWYETKMPERFGGYARTRPMLSALFCFF